MPSVPAETSGVTIVGFSNKESFEIDHEFVVLAVRRARPPRT